MQRELVGSGICLLMFFLVVGAQAYARRKNWPLWHRGYLVRAILLWMAVGRATSAYHNEIAQSWSSHPEFTLWTFVLAIPMLWAIVIVPMLWKGGGIPQRPYWPPAIVRS